MIAAPTAAQISLGYAEESGSYDLQFRLSEDSSVLSVREVWIPNPTGNNQSPDPDAVASWLVPAAAFGPRAFFDMAIPETDTERTIFVRNVDYGGRFLDPAKPGIVGFNFTRQGDRWRIAYSTNMWVSQVPGWTNPITSSKAVSFADFANAGTSAEPYEDVPGDRIDKTLRSVFDGLTGATPDPKEIFAVSLNRDLVWTIAPRGSARILALDAQLTISRLTLAWRRTHQPEGEGPADAQQAENGPSADPIHLAATADAADIRLGDPAQILRLGDRDNGSVWIQLADEDLDRFVAIVKDAPSLPERRQAACHLSAKVAGLAVAVGDANQVDGLAVTRLSVAQTRIGPGGVVRSTAWGMAIGATASVMAPASAQRVEHGPGDILSPIGLLRVHAMLPAEQDAGQGEHDQPDQLDLARLFQMINGDRGGSPTATFFALSDRASAGEADHLRRLHVDLALLGIQSALPDTSYSRLSFQHADLRLTFEDGQAIADLPGGEHPRPIASSFIWIGKLDGKTQRAQLSLSGALLTCGRDYDLMKLRFRFHDLVLAFGSIDDGSVAAPIIRPARPDARVWIGDDGAVQDQRPVLVAEFDPQHVMEEAILRPEPPPLPDVDLRTTITTEVNGVAYAMRTRDEIVAALERAGSSSARVKIRAFVRDQKLAQEGPQGPYRTIAEAYERASQNQPVDQRAYIGPFALDPDGMALARTIMVTTGRDAVRDEVRAMLARVDGLGDPTGALARDGRLVDISQFTDEKAYRAALQNEAVFETSEPFYALFRSFWRDIMVRHTTVRRQNLPAREWVKLIGADLPEGLDTDRDDQRGLMEYVSAPNRPKGYETAHWPDLVTKIVDAFVSFALGQMPEGLPDLMGARLSGRSRLAFRLDLETAPGINAHDAGAAHMSGVGPDNPGPGNTPLLPMPFTFEALTDWSRMEAAVTRRARKLFENAPNGILPPIGARSSNSSDHSMLRFQGFSSGVVTSDQRLSEIRTSLKSERIAEDDANQPFPGEPLDFETAIEIPSRLILSTAQDAVWRTNRKMPPQIYGSHDNGPLPERDESFLEYEPLPPSALDEGQSPAGVYAPSEHPRDLWSVRLETAPEIAPSLRAVSSPDLRSESLVRRGANPSLPGQGAPPRGPYAPWFIGPEQLENTTIGDICTVPPPDSASFLRWLCDRALFRRDLPARNYALFRSALDAYDRHQLVLLSSTYGLPVIGKRRPSEIEPDNVERGGTLIHESGQIEPGKGFSLLDAGEDQAIHRPVPLDVKALSLTALGGSLLHDTAFNPSAGADDFDGNKIFEGFSIEKVQQDIVLGRDIRTEVVYKGYLLPFRHRASFVKLTERVFLRTKQQGIKAILRQRMFLRIGDRDKLNGGLGQPHAGRMWCGRLVRVLIDQTRDLLDPNAPSAPYGVPELGEYFSGKLDLGDNPGLAFWPRTDMSEKGRVQFEVTIDGARTKLPMLFVDNIAATTSASLKAVADIYNVAANARHRTLQLGGQMIDYAPNSQSGEAQFETDQLHLRVHGRLLTPHSDKWTGVLDQRDNYLTTGVLEGANEPPFYPALDYARIRLGAMERMSGASPTAVDVQYDGHYVLHGFSGDPAPRGLPPLTEAARNPAEVFLNLRQKSAMGMSGNGDRSGGIARPAAHIVAISRKHGPMGGDRAAWAARTRAELSTDTSVITVNDDASATDNLAPLPALYSTIAGTPTLVSLAPYFNRQVPRPELKLEQSNPEVIDPIVLEREPDASELEVIRQVQSYFSLDARLLGTIRLRDMMRLLGLDIDSVPVLKEVREYGSAALRQADSLSDDVRTRVLLPLNDVIELLREEWRQLDEKLVEQQIVLPRFDDKPVKALRLAEIYPEIDARLGAVEGALEAALATSDALSLAAALPEIHKTARELIRALAILAANPVERLDAAVTANLRERIEALTSALDEFRKLAEQLDGMAAAFADQAADLIADAILDGLAAGPAPAGPAGGGGSAAAEIARVLPLSLLPPDLGAIVKKLVADTTQLETDFRDAVTAIGQDLAAKHVRATETHLREGLRAAILAALQGRSIEQSLADVVGAYLVAVREAMDLAIAAARTEVEKARNAASGALDVAAEALDRSLRSYAADVEALVLDAVAGQVAGSAELQILVGAIDQVDRAIRHGQVMAKAIRGADPKEILDTGAALAQDVLGIGIDLSTLQAEAEQRLSRYVSTGIDAFLAPLIPDQVVSNGDQPILRQELAAIKALEQDPSLPGPLPIRVVFGSGERVFASNDLLKGIGEALLALLKLFPEGSKGPLERARESIEADSVAINLANLSGEVAFSAENLALFSRELERLIRGETAPRDCLISDFRIIYAHIVNAVVDAETLRALAADAGNLTVTGRLDDAIALLARQVEANGRALGEAIEVMIDRLTGFLGEGHNSTIAAAGIMGGFLTELAKFYQLPQALEAIRGDLVGLENDVAGKLGMLVNFALGLVGRGASSADQALDGMAKVLAGLREATGNALDPELADSDDAVAALRTHIASFAKLQIEPPRTLNALINAETGKGPLSTVMARGGTAEPYRDALTAVRRLEAALLRHSRRLLQRIAGAPEALKRWAEDQLINSGVFGALASGYTAISTRRDTVISQAQGVAFLDGFVRQGMLVEPVAGLAADGLDLAQCNIAILPVADAAGCDRLHQELAVLVDAQTVVEDEASRAALRRRVVNLLQGWSDGQAAPLQIVSQVAEIGKNLLRGDILAAIDLNAFRDQVEDAIAALIPTKVNFSYDFVSTVTKPSKGQAIFQPKLGAPFGIEVRASVDLLTQKSDFSATAHMGPFEIFLIGTVVEAIRLKFGGAAFSVRSNASPRFDVIYESFEIGDDLEFAQKLQSYLTPKEGSGVFIQPMTRGAGIEAGYSLYLGTVGVGATSFFNVSLNVSAELPFGDSEALFKVSLGRRLAPFSMGVLPFVGSGYFSIYAAADGVRGFEAAFEYGGGGAIGYGPLSAECRIQVGVFVRVLKVDKKPSTTEIYGTFFAGGSASIWIFHFATSIYVRLGSAAGGQMYGEAIYSFSFSIGFADYDYSIRATRQEKQLGGGAGGNGQSNYRRPRKGYSPSGGGRKQHVVIDAVDQAENLAEYAGYFDFGLIEDLIR
jgi:hypothetical protein